MCGPLRSQFLPFRFGGNSAGIRAAAKARLKATKSVLGRPPATPALDETADEEAERLVNTIGDIESNPKDRRQSALPALRARLQVLDDLAETEENAARSALVTTTPVDGETDEHGGVWKLAAPLEPHNPAPKAQPVKIQLPLPKPPEPMRVPLPKNIPRTDK